MHSRKIKIIELIFFISIPLISCIVFSCLQGVAIWDINPLAASLKMNDEMFYYKQIEGMANSGHPLGYFGYNESTAAIGTYGTWSLTLFYPYAFLAKIFGMTPYRFMIFNIILLSIAFALFYKLVKPTVWQAVMILFVSIAFPTATRYMLSGLVESLLTAGAVIFAGLAIYMQNNDSPRWLIYISYIFAIYLALCRPWCLIFMVIPALAHIKKNFFECLLACIATVAVFGAIYVFYVNPRCAPFFVNMVQVNVLIECLSQGINVFITQIKEVIMVSYKGILNFITGNTERAIIYIVFFTDIILLSVCVVCSMVKKQYDKVMLFQAAMLFILITVLAAIVFLYSFQYGTRHLAALCLSSSMMLIMQMKPDKKYFVILMVVCVAITAFWRIRCMENHILPTDQNEYGTLPVEDAYLMETAFEADKMSDPWDNTVLFEFTELSQNYCYYLPENVGISFCYTNYVQDNHDILKSKYLLSDSDAEKKELYCSYGWNIMCEGEEYTLYQLR